MDPLSPTDVVAASPEPGSNAALVAMRVRFEADVADGLVGRHHNTYQHRSRVLRQMAQGKAVGGALAAPR